MPNRRPPANAHLHKARTELRHDMARLGGFCSKKTHMQRASCCLAAGGQPARSRRMKGGGLGLHMASRPVNVWVLTANEACFCSVPSPSAAFLELRGAVESSGTRRRCGNAPGLSTGDTRE